MTSLALPSVRTRLSRARAATARLGAAESAVVALLVLGAITVGGVRPLTVGLLWLALVTPRLMAVDIAEHRLPDAIVLPGYPIVLLAVGADAIWGRTDLRAALVAGIAYGGTLLVLHALGGMGLGDVKLAPVLGLLLGGIGPVAAVVGPLAAMFAGGAAAVVALIRFGPRAHIPFGPPMLLGAWAALLLPV
ncbi:prepilin peptidase [uncultured Amnibacterium sp.]|uniref:prepilin peptidase n=1 Tax=uncultured Amnibacterium sp. TaxID=1631851 RepID=UPI0035CBA98A